MHVEVLTKKQAAILPLLKEFKNSFGLVGGTAIALHLGHRRSIDFDLFSLKKFDNSKIQRYFLVNHKKIEHVFIDQEGEYSILVGGVKVTFLFYPFKIKFKQKLNNYLKLADLLTLAAMKAYSLGRRAKWTEYVDLYFIMNGHFKIKAITKKAKEIFGGNFNEKIFRSQLAYFKDIDYSEKVIYLPHRQAADEEIKKSLIKF